MRRYLLAVVVLLFVACANNANTPKLNQCERISYMDKSLSKVLDCEEIMLMTPNGLQANISFTNLKNTNAKLKLKIDWFDENGVFIDSILSNSKEVSILGKDIEHIMFQAPSKKAKNYKIRVYKMN